MASNATVKALIGPVNLSLDLSPNSLIIAEFENGSFNEITGLTQIHVVTPLKTSGETDRSWGPPSFKYECGIKPVLDENFSASQFPKQVSNGFKKQIHQIATSIGPQITARAESVGAWQVELQTEFEGKNYKLLIQYS